MIDAKRTIPNSTIVTRIFARQNPDSSWEKPHRPYLPKYKSSYWQIMILSQLGVDRTDERLERACEFISQFQHDEGGFAAYSLAQAMDEYRYLRKKGKRLPQLAEFVPALVTRTKCPA